ncbi:ankyrin repeat-containing protein [Anaeramoeba ignava]|uniref:Ankyrin repeat-containing protein n=1 Tax=Anaeramoeba ignava TaxID=1746090 RepID=A0A9Q0L6N8_ANAIG|nr:ankyrin repeat-containing protein [Anaeramoeba ignava]
MGQDASTKKLFLSCEKNSIKETKFHISKGADVNFKNENEETPLHFACKNTNKNSLEIIKYLIEKGADINSKNKYKETPFHLICQYPNENSIEILKYLIEKGADINSKNKNEETPLFFALEENDQKIIHFLLMNNANPFDLSINYFSKEFIDLFSQIYSINDDLNNLLKSNDNFSDLTIQSIDSSQFKVHKLILLTRFDNDETILQKFINIYRAKLKPDDEDYDSFCSDDEKYLYRITHENQEKEDKLKEFFKEIGIESNWIESKKGRKGILEDLHKLYQENQNKDFTIITEEEKEIKVHKLILILRSELYKGMFLNAQDSSNQKKKLKKKNFMI